MNRENDHHFIKRYKSELGVACAGLVVGWVACTSYSQQNQQKNLALKIVDEVCQHQEALSNEADDMEQELDQLIKHVNQTVDQHQKYIQGNLTRARKEHKQMSKEFQEDFDRSFNRILHGKKESPDIKFQETGENQ
jgi:hypothetical protein